jgi:hypothetical protein
MKVARHEVPGIDPTKIRPEGYGLNSVSRFHIGRPFPNLHTAKKTMGTEAAVRVVDHIVPYGTDPCVRISQALRARLRSCSPSGTKTFGPLD